MERDPEMSRGGRGKKPLNDPLTREDVEMVVKKALGREAQLVDYSVESSGEKLGFLGCYRHLLVKARRDDNSQLSRHSFFVKSVPYHVEEQASLIHECRAFVKETNFYREILPRLLASVEDKSWLPECYLVKEDSLVLEDLETRNFRAPAMFLDAAHLKAGLTVLGQLHASSILAESRVNRRFSEITSPELLADSIFCRTGRYWEWYVTGVDLLRKLIRHLELKDVPMDLICQGVFQKLTASTKRRNVICHGDPKAFNFMFDETRPIPKCVLIDFQLLRYVPASADILQLLYLASSREIRDKEEKQLLRHYHEVFSATLRQNNETIRGASLEELIQEYEEMRIVGLVTAGMYLPIMLLDGKTIDEMTSHSDGFTRLMFRDRFQLVLAAMTSNPEYEKFIRDILDEFIQRSDQLLTI